MERRPIPEAARLRAQCHAAIHVSPDLASRRTTQGCAAGGPTSPPAHGTRYGSPSGKATPPHIAHSTSSTWCNAALPWLLGFPPKPGRSFHPRGPPELSPLPPEPAGASSHVLEPRRQLCRGRRSASPAEGRATAGGGVGSAGSLLLAHRTPGLCNNSH